MRYVFVGTGTFAAKVVSHLSIAPDIIITSSDKTGGRGMKDVIPSPVKLVALQKNIPVVYADTSQQLHRALASYNSFPIILSDFGMIIPGKTLASALYGIWNIHPSLLPHYRGPTPIQTAILNGEVRTGVSIIQLDKKMDHGPLLAQKSVEIAENDTFESLRDTLAAHGAHMVLSLLENPQEALSRNHSQRHSEASYTTLFTKFDGYIQPEAAAYYLAPTLKKYHLTHILPEPKPTDLKKIDRMIRALSPWPGVWTNTAHEVIKIRHDSLYYRGKQYAILHPWHV